MTLDSPWYGAPSFAAPTSGSGAGATGRAGLRPGNPLQTRVAISASGSGRMQPLLMNGVVPQNLKEIGIEADFKVVGWKALLVIPREGGAKALQRGVTAINVSCSSTHPYSALMRSLKTEMVPPTGGNFGHYSDSGLDAMMDEVYRTMEPAAQDRILTRIHAEIVDRALFLCVARDLNPRAMGRRVQAFVQVRAWSQDLAPVRML